MSRRDRTESAKARDVLQFTLVGLVIFCLSLIAAASFISYKLAAINRPRPSDFFMVNPDDKSRSVHDGPWGTLVERKIQLEWPVEYLMMDDVSKPPPEVWTFNGLDAGAVKALLSQNGLTAEQAAAVCTPNNVREDKSGTVLTPPVDFLLSLDAATRARLYTALAGQKISRSFDYPFVFPGATLESIYADRRLNPDDVSLLKHLVYNNGGVWQLSNYLLLMGRIPTVDRRLIMTRLLTRQPSVLVGLHITPDTDIDKLASYWGRIPNVRFIDIRPLMEAFKALPEGGDLPLYYLMPKFARDRLYTDPLPPQPGDLAMDCHWTAFNFTSETPDNRFNDPVFNVQYIQKNYYQISAPSQYGDILLLMNNDEIIHSAVFLADDLVFTKNGSGFRNPWIVMRIADVLALYPASPPLKPVYIRLKTT